MHQTHIKREQQLASLCSCEGLSLFNKAVITVADGFLRTTPLTATVTVPSRHLLHTTTTRRHTHIKHINIQRLCQSLPSFRFHAAPMTLLHSPTTSGGDNELPALGPRVSIHKPVGNTSGSLINRIPFPN